MIRITPTGTATIITNAPRPRRLTGRRIALIIAAMILTPCFIALFAGMVIGISRAAAETTPAATSGRGPSAHTLDILDQARAASKTPCWAEWNEIQARLAAKGAKGTDGFPLDGFEVICAAR